MNVKLMMMIMFVNWNMEMIKTWKQKIFTFIMLDPCVVRYPLRSETQAEYVPVIRAISNQK